MTPLPNVVRLVIKPNAGNLRALADVELETIYGPLTIHNCPVFQKPGETPFVMPPSNSWTANDGTKKYTRIVDWPRSISEAVTQAVTESLGDFPDGFESLPARRPTARQQTPQRQTFGDEVRRRAGIGGQG